MIGSLYRLKAYRAILCLNGALPPADFFKKQQLPIIAADGAANQLLAMGIEPLLVIGDLDSIDANTRQRLKHLYLPNQDQNDFQKALTYLKEKAYLPALMVGVHGGFLDHILNNINLFMDTGSLLYAPPVYGFVVREKETVRLELPENSKISILGIPNAWVSSQGLRWELKKSRLSFPGENACFNRSVDEEVVLEVHEGFALVLIYERFITDAGLIHN